MPASRRRNTRGGWQPLFTSRRLSYARIRGQYDRVIVGSINLTPGSFDSRRDLAIEVHSARVIGRLVRIAHHDWKHSHPLDLSDAGLLKELEKHKMDGSEELALRQTTKKRKKR